MVITLAETVRDKPGVYSLGFLSGILTMIAIPFVVALGFWIGRRLRDHLLYATPKHLERRVNLAAQFVDARRAYRVGGDRVWFALCVGRQYRHQDQAAAILADEFLPRDEQGEPANTR